MLRAVKPYAIRSSGPLVGSAPRQPPSIRHASAYARKACTEYLDPTHPDEPAPAHVKEAIAKFSRYALVPYVRPPLIVSKGKGCKIWDSEGREYLDMTAGIAVNALGHADEGVARVLAVQAARLSHASNLFFNEHAGALAELLVNSTLMHGGLGFEPNTPPPEPTASTSGLKVFLANSGTEANEGALKFARKYGKQVDPTGKQHGLVCFDNAFHGRTFGSLSVTYQPKYQEPFAPLLPGVKNGVFNDVAAINELVDHSTCGVIVEPIQGEGGILEASEEFLRALRKRCDEVNAVLIFDEIQCGLGRTGKLWAHSAFPTDCHPDVVTLAKPLANGVPVGAILMKDHVAGVIKPGDHGTTFGGGALQAAVACHVLDRLANPSFLTTVSTTGSLLRSRLAAIPALFPRLVHPAGPRGRGLIQGLPLTAEGYPARVVKLCRERGVLLLTCGNATVRFVPSLTVSEAEVNKACDVLESALAILDQEVEEV